MIAAVLLLCACAAQDAGPARAERLELWESLLASGAVAEIVETGPQLVAAGGALAGDVEATSLVARALFDAGQAGAARALLAALRLAEDDPHRAFVALAEASMALDEDRLERVLALLDAAPPQGPAGQPEAGATAAAVRFPSQPLAWLLVGRAHARRGDAQRADGFLERFVAAAPLHPEAPAALHLLARHALTRRDAGLARALRAEAERRARWHEVFRARALAKAAHPTAPEPRLALAELWRVVGATDRARAELEALLTLEPDNAEARARLAALDE